MQPINFDLTNKEVIVKKINFDNQVIMKKFKNIGLYQNQTITIKRVGNYKHLIGIQINGITIVIRMSDARNIMVELVK